MISPAHAHHAGQATGYAQQARAAADAETGGNRRAPAVAGHHDETHDQPGRPTGHDVGPEVDPRVLADLARTEATLALAAAIAGLAAALREHHPAPSHTYGGR
ncbi:hypothetical protein [Nonomuraea typhae]|uniref:hypothetical protein n=1 Tax=Nonomuraea typhae TaxID=2603600 RepID=UPI0012FAF7B1|nr:hypothetical protein [Nonomuraea typhae]